MKRVAFIIGILFFCFAAGTAMATEATTIDTAVQDEVAKDAVVKPAAEEPKAAVESAPVDLRANEKAVYDEFAKLVPADKVIGIEAFKKVHEEILAGTRKAYIIDCRTHPEFYAFHIEGADHIHAGHMYTIPRKIKDPNAEIYCLCRTQHRSFYVGGFLYKYGFKNVHVVEGGVVGWVKAGLPVVNQFAGRFVVIDYQKNFTEEGKYRIREFHPY